jgi:hypothetical protein
MLSRISRILMPDPEEVDYDEVVEPHPYNEEREQDG